MGKGGVEGGGGGVGGLRGEVRLLHQEDKKMV